jgi:general secretion pathway protein E
MILLKSRSVKVASFLETLNPKLQSQLLQGHRNERVSLISEALNLAEEAVVREVAKDAKLDFLKTFKLLDNISDIIPVKLIHGYQCLPIEPPEGSSQAAAAQSHLHLVTVWPPELEMEQWISIACGRKVVWYLTFPELVSNTIIQRFGVGANSLDDSELSNILDEEAKNAEEENEDAAIIRFVNEIIAKAIQERATDIHFEPHKNALCIRYRIDGQLIPVNLPENLVKFQAAVISRLKIMSKLNISEKRRPQDGRIRFSSGVVEMDIRLSTLPIMYGESVSLRLLNQGSTPMTLTDLGLHEDDNKVVDAALAKPHGIILVTGPTGSGKSTTLSACIRKIRGPERRIMTVEDPVEYEIDGVNQSQVRSEVGFNFANALRHILRQDPDVIMIGEIRDQETADIAIRGALTGHLVLSSLHTNDAPGALTRLIDMGIEPFLVASSIELIIAQRLVRRLCVFCSQPANIDQETLKFCLGRLGMPMSELKNAHLVKKAVGCEHCRHMGYMGRVGIFEILKMSEAIHRLIVQKASSQDIRAQGIKEGMQTLQNSGWQQVKAGLTTLDAVMRFAVAEDDNVAGIA